MTVVHRYSPLRFFRSTPPTHVSYIGVPRSRIPHFSLFPVRSSDFLSLSVLLCAVFSSSSPLRCSSTESRLSCVSGPQVAPPTGPTLKVLPRKVDGGSGIPVRSWGRWRKISFLPSASKNVLGSTVRWHMSRNGTDGNRKVEGDLWPWKDFFRGPGRFP